MDDFYTILNLDKSTASETEIKKAFKKAALLYHPDRNVHNKDNNIDDINKKFNEIKLAYDTLIDPEKKKLYDLYGKDSIKDFDSFHNMPPFDMSSLFGGMMGGMGGMGAMGGMGGMGGMSGMGGMMDGISQLFNKKENLDIDVDIILTLEELFNGTDKNLKYVRNVMCTKCKGSGALNDNAVLTCSICNGNGMKSMNKGFAQLIMTCDSCYGKGRIIKDNMHCKQCNGEKIIKKEEELTTHITPLIDNNNPIKIKKLGNYSIANKNKGDLNIHIKLLKHDIFKVEGRDLIMKKNIDLYSSLFGAKFIIHYLDGTKLYISHKDIIAPNTKKIIYGKGLKDGNLIIEFHVIFPKSVDMVYKRQLSKILHRKRETLDIDNNDQVLRVELNDYDPGMNNNTEEEDDANHNIECVTQ